MNTTHGVDPGTSSQKCNLEQDQVTINSGKGNNPKRVKQQVRFLIILILLFYPLNLSKKGRNEILLLNPLALQPSPTRVFLMLLILNIWLTGKLEGFCHSLRLPFFFAF
jgi:hypothetical protein